TKEDNIFAKILKFYYLWYLSDQ
uniref:Uncharacterized protein n=1 Tax=Amphimedon queenslandica TaxID=400682 RepID=A0A1X7SQ43_AMPQE